MNSKTKGNVAMIVSKTFSGLNENALRYLLPTWMSAYSGVVLRLFFGSVFFWIYSLFSWKEVTETKVSDKIKLLLLGAVCVFGYMFFLLEGLTYTTPISSSIFISMQPIWVFIMAVCMHREKATMSKIFGILLGFGGALLCILTQRQSNVASDPMLGNMFCLCSSVLYAIYLVASKNFLRRIDMITVSKWSFTGGAFSALFMIMFTGWYAPVLDAGLFSVPMLVLLFVLIFPTSLSYLLIEIGLKNLSATVVALYGYLILIVAAVVSYILGQDHFDWWQVAAIVMMVASVYFVEVSEAKTKASPKTKA